MKPELALVRDQWDVAAHDNPMGFILTTGEPWDVDDFYAHGRIEINECLARLDGLGLRGSRRERALDFGCGVGRLTQALTAHYRKVEGVDASPEMIRLARNHNRQGFRARYSVNGERLRFRPGSFDLIYTMIVLQHMPQRFAHAYIRQFIQLLHPEGLAVFEIPDGPDIPHVEACLSMYGTARQDVEALVADVGGEVLDVEDVNPCTWDCNRYTARRLP